MGDKMNITLYALGWDVGGWMGKNNSFVLLECNRKNNKLNWYYNADNYQLDEGELFELETIFNNLVNKPLLEDVDLVLGIDAPLTFPKKFINFLNDEKKYITKPELEIFNPLAFRATDRYIYRQYGKKPLSATFDRLGNNATVAMSHIRYWQEKLDIEVNNLQFNKKSVNVIETYPALLKPGKYKKAFPKIHKLIPEQINKGTDNYDAALCALMALQFGFNNNYDGLPSLVYPPQKKQIYKDEGWIYHFALDNLKRVRS